MSGSYPIGFRNELIVIIEEWNGNSHYREVEVCDSKLIEGEFDIKLTINRRIKYIGLKELARIYGKSYEDIHITDTFHTFYQAPEFGSNMADVQRLKDAIMALEYEFCTQMNDIINRLYAQAKV